MRKNHTTGSSFSLRFEGGFVGVPMTCPSAIFGVSAMDFNDATPGNGVFDPSLTGMAVWPVTGGIIVSWQTTRAWTGEAEC